MGVGVREGPFILIYAEGWRGRGGFHIYLFAITLHSVGGDSYDGRPNVGPAPSPDRLRGLHVCVRARASVLRGQTALRQFMESTPQER